MYNYLAIYKIINNNLPYIYIDVTLIVACVHFLLVCDACEHECMCVCVCVYMCMCVCMHACVCNKSALRTYTCTCVCA